MDRRNFLESLALAGSGVIAGSLEGFAVPSGRSLNVVASQLDRALLQADVAVVGAGLGGIAATLSMLRNGLNVILVEETDWVGGQLTQQGVPADEHSWIESHGAPLSYRNFRERIREYYRQNYPLTLEARENKFLNPGNGAVSRLCHEPKAALSVFHQLLAPYLSNGQLTLLMEHKAFDADASETTVSTVRVQCLNTKTIKILKSNYFIDATELGDLLPITSTDHIIGTESKSQTGELHAPIYPDPENQQAFTTCFAIDYIEGEDFVQKPEGFSFWKKYIPDIVPRWSGHLLSLEYSDPRTLKSKLLGFDPTGAATNGTLNLWNYRRIIDRRNFETGFFESDISLVNWPQNDYMLGNLIGVSPSRFKDNIEHSKQLGLSLLYWLQTEAPRPNGGFGWRGLRLRKDIMGTSDGFAKYPYVRESRRIKSEFTVLEQHIGQENRALTAGIYEDANKASEFFDSVGIGYYHIDLHPTTKVNYIDFPSLRFQIPLGALLPIKMDNLLPANKNIGTTHITNGCFRLHPVEWSIGEAVGLLLVFCKSKNKIPREVRKNRSLLKEFQNLLREQGVETTWQN
ncbi:FAD-dependent oxidoreductase [Sphingobacterium faecale]|uniref:FAD-dependent oxidoreductase n=1 Tax=Sphingobacterium faecale TaxID=2803775 RepID=A0ABS1R0R9_9SPHI|nr:FAD-dependent oxidoreductase [Sphingobacterium faecale]MBL1408258.1 FAD-dependent oxidoreductase [Sphingobacterium faecale]